MSLLNVYTNRPITYGERQLHFAAAESSLISLQLFRGWTDEKVYGSLMNDWMGIFLTFPDLVFIRRANHTSLKPADGV